MERGEAVIAPSGVHDLRGAAGLSPREAAGFLVLALAIAWLFGSFSRFPFDDEIYTLDVIRSFDLRSLFLVLLGGYDIHPPLSYMLFALLRKAGAGAPAMRLASLLLSGAGFLLVLDMTLAGLPRGPALARPLAVFAFAAFPLLYGAGDALRWYPLLTFLVALFFRLEILRGEPGIAAGLALGLAASTNFLAILPYLAFALRRYLWKRQFRWGADGPFHLALLATAWPGLLTFSGFLRDVAAHGAPDPFLGHFSLARGLGGTAHMLLGFFGGYRIGVLESPAALPYLVLLLLALGALAPLLARPHRGEVQAELAARGLLLAGLSLAYPLLTGFDRAHAFLFLAPFAPALLCLGYWRSALGARNPLALPAAAALLLAAALAGAHGVDDPFKRSLAIPYEEVVRFARDNTSGEVLFASSESVSAHLMARAGYCTAAWGDTPPPCLAPAGGELGAALRRFRFVVLLRDHNFAGQALLRRIEAHLQAERVLVARARFGRDRGASLKGRLLGTPLPPWLAEVAIYR